MKNQKLGAAPTQPTNQEPIADSIIAINLTCAQNQRLFILNQLKSNGPTNTAGVDHHRVALYILKPSVNGEVTQ